MSPLDFTSQIGTFQVATRVVFGAGALNTLPEHLRSLGTSNILLVSDIGLRKAGIVGRVEDMLHAAGFRFQVFDQVEPNPSVETVNRALNRYRSNGCDGLVGLGGGSPLDTAKAVGVLASNEGRLQDFVGLNKFSNPLPPLVAVPTTVGTGSEVTTFDVITDHARKKKVVLGSSLLAPKVAILDPELTMTLPRALIASTGLDALTHAVESYITTMASDFTDAVGLQAVRLIAAHLEKGVSSQRDLRTMGHLLHASCLGGMAFSYGRTALVHGMAHPLGAYYDVPHGVANAMLLPPVMRYNRPACAERLADLARAMGVAGTDTPTEEAADAFVSGVTELCRRVGIPQHLSELGVTGEFIPQMAEDAAASGNAQVNPRRPTVAEVEELYRSIL